MELTSIRINGMKCDGCAETITNALTSTAGVERASVNFINGRADISFNREHTDVDALKQVIRDAGYEIKPMHGEDGVCCGSCGGQ
ncbi:MAG: CCGSCS motif protein [Venatoribacter sp.]